MDQTRKSSGISGDDWDEALLGQTALTAKPQTKTDQLSVSPPLLEAVATSKLLTPLAGMFLAIVILAGVQVLPSKLFSVSLPLDQGYEQLGQTGLSFVGAVIAGSQTVSETLGQTASDFTKQIKTLTGNLSLALENTFYVAIDFGRDLSARVSLLFSELFDQLNQLLTQTMIRAEPTRTASSFHQLSLATQAGIASLGETISGWFGALGQWLLHVWQKITGAWRAFFFGVSNNEESAVDFNSSDRANLIEIKHNVQAILKVLSGNGSGGSVLPANGAVVVPATGDAATDAALKAQIAKLFSDQVSVKLDDTRQSGIITPVFKEGAGSDYIFLLAPIEN